MKVSGKGLAEILSHEAIVTRRYKDSTGVWTFGVGHTAAAGQPDPQTVTTDQPIADILRLFRKDLRKYEAEVNRTVKVKLAQHEFDALVSFHFNTGGISKAAFIDKLNEGDRDGAAKGMMTWKKPPEIIPRRQREQRLFRDGVYSNDGTVRIYPASDAGKVLWGDGRRVSIRDLVNEIRTPRPRPDVETDIAEQLRNKTMVQDVQRSLDDLGYPVGGIDGIIGSMTTAALAAYRFDRQLEPAVGIDDVLLKDMLKAADEGWQRPVMDDRANKPSKEIAEKSGTMKVSWWGRLLLWLGIPGAVAGQAAEEAVNPDQLETRLTFLQRMSAWALDNMLLLAILVVIVIGGITAFKIIDWLKVARFRAGVDAT